MTQAFPAVDHRLARKLVLDELFDLSLYRALRDVTTGELGKTLDELVAIESRHFTFWQEFFDLKLFRLDLARRLRLGLTVLACRLFGEVAVHLVLEAIEVYGVRKYLGVWETYRGGPLADAVKEILEDELRHEDRVVTGLAERKINPERIRNIFLGLNDGLVEILGAVSGFFGAFGDPVTVLLAASTTAVAGALSMAAGAYVATSSEQEVTRTERAKRRFLGEAGGRDGPADSPVAAAALVGASYFGGAVVPVLPVLLGARGPFVSVVTAGVTILVVSLALAFLSGMAAGRRVFTNLVIIAAAVVVTYAIGSLVKAVWGVSL